MRLTLAVPGLLALDPAVLAAVPSLSRLARYAGPPATRRGTLDALVVSGSGEGAGAAPLAALLKEGPRAGAKAGVILTGGNIDREHYLHALTDGWT